MTDKDDAAGGTSPGADAPRLTPRDVQQKEFRVSFRGYNEREVDEFLDKVTEELQRYEREVMRIRSERIAVDPSSFDLDAEAQRILNDARERADSIVREAEARASGIPTASAAEARAVVAPYLNREREFLEQLGTLVQGHARSIKTMVEEARRRTESAASSSGTLGAVASPDTRKDVTDRGERDLVILETQALEAEASVSSDDEETRPDGEAEGARSLRELFWGED
jgi:cell division initiation protein